MIRRHHAHASGAGLPRRTLTLLAIVFAAVVAGGTAGTAEAAQPCWKKLVNDWYDGRIDGTYPVKCYRKAIDNLPRDVEEYSSAAEDIRRALLSAIRDNGGPLGPNALVRPPGAPRGDGGRKESPLLGRDEGDDAILPEASGKGLFDDFFDRIGPNSADAVPLPILILAGIAFLLLAAALASAVTRRVHERRITLADGPPDRR